MQKSYVVKRPVNFADFNFFVKVGDILKHDTQNHNSLTVYRGGAIVKTLSQTVLGIKAMLMNDFIAELHDAPPAPAKVEPVKEVVKAPEPVKIAPKPAPKKEEPKKSGYTAEEYTPAVKRGKAQPKEVSVDEMPEQLRKALAIEDETV